MGQAVEIRRRFDQPPVDQLLDDLVAKAVDIHRSARYEMDDRLLKLRLAGQTADATVDRAFAHRLTALAALDQLGTLHGRTTHRALLRHMHGARVGRAAFGNYAEDLGNHIACTSHDHRIADHHAKPRHFIHVVQRRVGHRNARHLHRLQPGHRGDRAGTADLEFHIEQLGDFLPRGKLVGDGPARLARPEAQFTLLRDRVDLEHHTVNLIRQRVALFTDGVVVSPAFGHAPGQFQLTADGQAPAFQGLENTDVRVRQFAVAAADAVGTKFERTAGSDLRIQLTQASSSGVARIGEGFAAAFQLSRVERFEAGLGHVDLAAHLEYRRPATAMQLQWNVAHGTHIGADVLTRAAIAPGGAAHQMAVLIKQADRQTIQFGFAAVLDYSAIAEQVTRRQIQSFAHAAVEIEQILLLEGIAQTQHRHFVAHLTERRQCRATDPLGWRLGCHQLRVLRLERLELIEQTVVLGVGNAGFVEHVVAVVVGVNFAAQFGDALGGGLGGRHKTEPWLGLC